MEVLSASHFGGKNAIAQASRQWRTWYKVKVGFLGFIKSVVQNNRCKGV